MRASLGSRLASGAAVLALASGLAVTGSASAAASEQIPSYTPYFELFNHSTGKCLEVSDWRRDAGAPVRQWTCTGGANQQWAANSNGFLVNRNSGLCLDIPGGSTVWGERPVQSHCAPRPASGSQRWYVPGVNSDPVGTVGNGNGLVLDVAGYDASDGAPVIQWGANGGLNQLWTGLRPPVRL
ncbi:RICIN domain-containing protein [Kitasatospora sp. NPDC002965]|uniref:RICIN domain-containing protein n=1 Tax=Kitasatospora sp. NPDC002965 TaxID=3154775 RepID=UPI0033BDB3CB